MTVAAQCTTRIVESDELDRAIPRLEEWLDLPACLVDTYPHVFGERRVARSFGAFVDGELVSHVAVVTLPLHVDHQLVRAALLGSVATDPEFRGHGLASNLMRHVAAVAGNAGCDTLWLWSDLWEFYERIGFSPGGRQLELELELPADSDDTGVREARPEDAAAILALHEAKRVRAHRDLELQRLLLQTRPMTTMVLEVHGEVVAYACQGKGADFVGWWHEFGGSDRHVRQLLLGSMTRLGQRTATMVLPLYRSGLVDLLSDCEGQVREAIAGLCAPLTAAGCTPAFLDGLDSI